MTIATTYQATAEALANLTVSRKPRNLVTFCTDITDDAGNLLVSDFECEIEVEAYLDGGAPVVSVHSVYVGETDIMHSADPLAKALAYRVADAAEATDWVIERACEDAEIAYSGSGSNDPDGNFVRK